MYVPEQFRDDRPQFLSEFIARHPLGALVASAPQGLIANHVPLLWLERSGTPGVLAGHIARANPLWRVLAPDSAVLVIFTGASHYLTPSWYPAKQLDGKVVPTWNYSVVHVHGTLRFMHGPEEALRIVSALTTSQEAARPQPWAVTDAPADYLAAMLERIVPFEIAVTRMEGKVKASQHRPQEERAAVTRALQDAGLAPHEIAELVRAPLPR